MGEQRLREYERRIRECMKRTDDYGAPWPDREGVERIRAEMKQTMSPTEWQKLLGPNG